jgi:uncharacterized membrane protein
MDFENNLDEDQNIDVEVHLYNLDQDKSEESTDANIRVKKDHSRILKLDLDIPEDLDLDDEYAIYVKTEDSTCNQDYLSLELERPEEKVEITEFELPTSANCGDTITARIKTENFGSQDQDVSIKLKSRGLDVDEESSTFELTDFESSDNKESKEFSFKIPTDVETGTYEIKATASYSSEKSEQTKTIEISCRPETFSGTTLNPTSFQYEKITLNRKATNIDNKNVQQKTDSSLLIPASLLFMLNVILVGATLLLYISYIKKK